MTMTSPRRRPRAPPSADDDSFASCSRILCRATLCVAGLLGALYISNLENHDIDIAVERSFEKQHIDTLDFTEHVEDAALLRGRSLPPLTPPLSPPITLDGSEGRESESPTGNAGRNDIEPPAAPGKDEGESGQDGDGDKEDDPSKPKFAPEKIRRIALLGERNSGTRWISAELIKCFPQVTVTPRLLRWKHWFQDDDGKAHNPTLVVAQFRNPYEWTEAMRHVPHHAPEHLGMEWKEFVTKPWTMDRPKRDLDLEEKSGNVCYEKFRYDQLISCVEGNYTDPEYRAMYDKKTGLNSFGHPLSDPHDFSAHKPIYELKQDGSGEPFESILHMRTAKIRNFLSLKEWDWIADSIPVRYETLLAEGTDGLLSLVEKLTGLARECEASEKQNRRRREVDPNFLKWMNKNHDWESEALIGYEKWDDPSEEELKEAGVKDEGEEKKEGKKESNDAGDGNDEESKGTATSEDAEVDEEEARTEETK